MAILCFAHLFRHFLARESAKSIFPARWMYLEKRTPKPLKSHKDLSTNSKGGRRGGLMVSALHSGASGPGLSPGRGHCVVFLGKTLYSHSASLHPGV